MTLDPHPDYAPGVLAACGALVLLALGISALCGATYIVIEALLRVLGW